ncbi:hypothetical protein K8S19_13675 [bacterium]|nr:hypothetical protein [bacterium]
MNKILDRVMVLNLAIVYFIAFFSPISISNTSETMNFREVLLMIWILLSMLSIIYFVITQLRHLRGKTFSKNIFKYMWSILIVVGIFGLFFGSILYHILVVEFRFTLKK